MYASFGEETKRQIMITHYVDFCQNALRFMPLDNYFPFESYSISDDEITTKQFLFHLWKTRVEDRCTLSKGHEFEKK